MKDKKIIYIAVVLFIVLGGVWLGLKYLSASMEQDNVYSVSEIKNDDSTYKYVKGKCDSGSFAADSQNCINLKQAR